MRFAIVTALMLSISPALASAQTAQQAPLPAPNTMSRQELRDEVTQQRAIIQGRAVRPQRPAGCVSPESRQFDFWLCFASTIWVQVHKASHLDADV